MIFSTIECGSSIVNTCKIDEFQLLVLVPFWVSFWMCFGSPIGGQGHQKATSKKRQKNDAQNDPKLVPKGVPKWSQNHQKWGLGSTLFQGWLPSGLQTPSRIDFGEVLGPFWDHFRQFFWHSFTQPALPQLVAQLWKANILRRIAPDCVQVITAIKALMAATFGFTKRPLWLHFICKKKSKTFCKGSFLIVFKLWKRTTNTPQPFSLGSAA